MASSVLTEMTKKIMAESLKKLMATKPLNKISIKEITDDCGVNRQTFYYHFHDIYDLLAWMYHQEALILLKQNDSCLTWDDGLILLLRYIQKNEAIALCTLNSLGHDHLKQFFYNDIYSFSLTIVNELAEGLTVSDYHKNFIAHFYTVAFAGLVENWLRDGMKESPEELVHLITITTHDNMKHALQRFAKLDT
ncbi:TetR/AcrR family transcriptional regulator [Anaerovorax odorimutans]|uniref:TetR/AcrR family transcriptional regulator n=1 Tax=Anaerovorax odorimutans TaxID=109327 RepID=UPI0003F9AB68|nr:TetR/AcrR family transcriptional regulator [Anaerovorax odorimutans]